ncbi:glutamate racemase [Patescibacteria group bacterium]|nr:glutamate racemase [Patescibacteria group bacterium]MCL5091328.1 glutamate racemase [Patescibacteria group bacterium]
MNIGVFDSGLGGLTIFKALLQQLPQYNYVYLGDNARVPYGNRSAETIYQFTKQALEFLFKHDCLLIIIACNTSTATTLRRIQTELLPQHHPDKHVLGIIKPVVETVAASTARRVGVIATRATVESGSFIRELKKENPAVAVFQNAGPLLVPFIEEGELKGPVLQTVLKRYIDPLLRHGIDHLILGCTHYGLIKPAVQQAIGNKVKVMTEEEVVAQKLRSYLKKHPEVETKLGKTTQRRFFITDYSPRYQNLVRLFLGNHFQDHHRLELVKLT